MLNDLFTGPHIIIVLVIVVLLFGATRLPALAKALGQSGRIFKSEMKASAKDDAAANGTGAGTGTDATNGTVNNTTVTPADTTKTTPTL